MSTFVKAAVIGLGLLAGAAYGAQAQTSYAAPAPGASIANLPPPGPRASSALSIPSNAVSPVASSPRYPGPRASHGDASPVPRFEKPADWDQNTAMHPYTSGLGPKVH